MNLDQTWVDANCPNCDYLIDFQLIDVKTEKTIYCHNCKGLVTLADGDASTHNTIDSVQEAFNELEKTLKNLGK